MEIQHSLRYVIVIVCVIRKGIKQVTSINVQYLPYIRITGVER